MKAKDIAKHILTSTEASHVAAADAVIVLINEALQVVATRKQDASKYATLREAFQKWRSIVKQVLESEPAHPIKDALFLQALYLHSPAGFAQCAAANVFLGYALSEQEQAVLAAGQEALRAAEQAEEARRRAQYHANLTQALTPAQERAGQQDALRVLRALAGYPN